MLENSPKIKQLVQLSEQVFDPIQVPIQVGGDIYIIVQQDVRRIEDSRYLSYYKYTEQQQPQQQQQQQLPQQINSNPFDENHLWDTLVTALLAARSFETNQHKINLINRLLENLNRCNQSENQMQWEPENKCQKDTIPICSFCNCETSSKNKHVRFIEDFCYFPPPPILRNRGTVPSFCIDDKQPNVHEKLLQKKKSSNIFF